MEWIVLILFIKNGICGTESGAAMSYEICRGNTEALPATIGVSRGPSICALLQTKSSLIDVQHVIPRKPQLLH